MKKIVLTTLLASSALLIFAPSAHAESNGTDATTDVGIRFESDGGDTTTTGPFKGNLAMVYVPKQFNFGLQKATGQAATYFNTVDKDQHLVVNDDRDADAASGMNSGWKVSAKMSKLTSNDATPTAVPATVKFAVSKPQAYTIGNTMNTAKTDLEPNPVEGNVTDFAPGLGANYKQTSTVSLESDASSTIVLTKNKDDEEKGGVAVDIANTQMTLVTDKNMASKSFTGTVAWHLDNTI